MEIIFFFPCQCHWLVYHTPLFHSSASPLIRVSVISQFIEKKKDTSNSSILDVTPCKGDSDSSRGLFPGPRSHEGQNALLVWGPMLHGQKNVKCMFHLRHASLSRNKCMWLDLTRCALLRFVGAPRWKCRTTKQLWILTPSSLILWAKIAVRPGSDLGQTSCVLSPLLWAIVYSVEFFKSLL